MGARGKAGLGLGTVALLAAVSVGCSSSDNEDSSSSSTSTTVESPMTSDAPGGSGSGSDVSQVAANEATGIAVLADGEAPPERTITMSDTAFTPSSLTIDKGQNVTFKAGADGIYAVIVGRLDGVTVTGGLIETFDFPEAGTYTISEDLNGYTGTITVE